jgi:membrane glycosyltransferase
MRLPATLTLFGAIHAGLAALFTLSVAGGGTGMLWSLWVLCGVVTLFSIAMELTMVLVWLWLRVRGRLFEEPYVPAGLTSRDRRELTARSPQVAILIPAHNEATTPEDSEGLKDRVVEILRNTPNWSTLFLLFDSPQDQRENELSVITGIKSELRKAGRHADAGRVAFEEYRNKPKRMRNKPGSIELWLASHAQQYQYMFVLDADSSLAAADDSRPEERDILARLVLAMERHPELAMIQSAIQIRSHQTIWGWFQAVNGVLGSRYHGPLFQWLLSGQVPSYGHNVLFRVSDFVNHVKNTLQYLSHDFLDAADLATAGRKCIHTHNVVTYEQTEESLLGYLVRELRWARGNAQWVNYWLSKPGLALGPRVFLAIGIMAYVLPMMASLMPILSVFLIYAGVTLITATHLWAAYLLLALVVIALFLPKVIAARSVAEFDGTAVVGALISPALMLLRGILFLIAAFGSKWSPRGSRTPNLDFEHAAGILRWFCPVALLGIILQFFFLQDTPAQGFGMFLIRAHTMLLIASPLLALILSCPLPKLAAAQHNDLPDKVPLPN